MYKTFDNLFTAVLNGHFPEDGKYVPIAHHSDYSGSFCKVVAFSTPTNNYVVCHTNSNLSVTRDTTFTSVTDEELKSILSTAVNELSDRFCSEYTELLRVLDPWAVA